MREDIQKWLMTESREESERVMNRKSYVVGRELQAGDTLCAKVRQWEGSDYQLKIRKVEWPDPWQVMSWKGCPRTIKAGPCTPIRCRFTEKQISGPLACISSQIVLRFTYCTRKLLRSPKVSHLLYEVNLIGDFSNSSMILKIQEAFPIRNLWS